ncbi:heterokaryon incompatibility protein-domain-containing protein [Cadophora sp. MPI-SDFR-AT-0126]|nr:heterokaryon incompatibility protein-domain-containing protein [Leotiomycetes sp. MPI-SDFR-AT-0126]
MAQVHQQLQLCTTCQNLFGSPDWRQGVQDLQNSRLALWYPAHHTDLIALIQSSRHCVFCFHLLQGAEGYVDISYVAEGVRISLSFVMKSGVLRGGVSSSEENSVNGGLNFPLVCLYPSSYIHDREFEPSTSSRSSLSFASDWLAECISSHPSCSSSKTPYSPTRLVEVHDTGARLCITSNRQVNLNYLTLSHCWGTIEMFKLMRNNIDALCQEIPVDMLSKTFRDALAVTKALGLKYIWIDSLCIVQDENEDWERESVLMSNVYGNAVANIAASHAKDGSEGLFIERDLKAGPHFVQTSDPARYCTVSYKLYDRCIGEAPLSKRAWAFQERYLAPRTIFFTKDQIFCECSQHIVSESFPEGIPDELTSNRPPRKTDYSRWDQIIKVYSTAKVTFPKDRFIALSGVCDRFQQANQDQYVAGLWRTNLERQLCWAAIANASTAEPGSSSPGYKAPSWSWASIEAPVTWRLYTTNNILDVAKTIPVVEIITVALSLVGENVFGQLASAELGLQCSSLISGRHFKRYGSLGSDTIPPIEGDCRLNVAGQIYPDDKTYGRDFVNFAGSTYLLPILVDTSDKKMDSGLNLYGLVVTPASLEERNGNFKRLGVFDIRIRADSFVSFQTLLSQHPQITMDESMYKMNLGPDADGTKWHTVTLI